MRIVTITGKIIYVVGVYALLLVLNIFVFMRLVNPTIDVLIVAILNIAYVVVGVRTFRGATENREDPRAWWRATARPAAGFWIGAGLAVASGISLRRRPRVEAGELVRPRRLVRRLRRAGGLLPALVVQAPDARPA